MPYFSWHESSHLAPPQSDRCVPREWCILREANHRPTFLPRGVIELPQSDPPSSDSLPTMSSYLSNLLTQTTSKYNSLRRTLLANEDDGDSEDDSHISRVLRAYYAEKGRPLPPWLPPDPNDRRAVTPSQFTQSGGNGGGYFTGKSQLAGLQNQSAASNRSSLSDLWDAPAKNTAPALKPQSLRAGYRPPQQAAASSLAPPAPQARPLPSLRAGSYQAQQHGRPALDPTPPSSSSGGGASAQERLKARLWGAGGGLRSGTPPSSGGDALSQTGEANPYERQQQQTPRVNANAPWSGGGGGGAYDRGGGDLGGSGWRYGRTG